jgi:hypothetical protein
VKEKKDCANQSQEIRKEELLKIKEAEFRLGLACKPALAA